MVVVCCSTSLVLDSFNKYGLYVAIVIEPETKHSGGLATLSETSSKQAKSVSALVLLVSTKKWIKTLWLLLWDVNDNQVNTKRIKLIGTLTIQVRLICENRYFCLFVGDLLISVSPKHPTGSKAKITFFDCSSNISSSNSLPLSLQTSICSMQELKESQQLPSLPLLADIFKIYDHTVTWQPWKEVKWLKQSVLWEMSTKMPEG